MFSPALATPPVPSGRPLHLGNGRELAVAPVKTRNEIVSLPSSVLCLLMPPDRADLQRRASRLLHPAPHRGIIFSLAVREIRAPQKDASSSLDSTANGYATEPDHLGERHRPNIGGDAGIIRARAFLSGPVPVLPVQQGAFRRGPGETLFRGPAPGTPALPDSPRGPVHVHLHRWWDTHALSRRTGAATWRRSRQASCRSLARFYWAT